MKAVHSSTLILVAAGLVALGTGCGRESAPSATNRPNWVVAANLTDHQAYTLQFKLYHAQIPHNFEQTNAGYIVRVPDEFRAQALKLIQAHTNSAGGRLSHG
jgi:hypothetical protein